MPRGSVLGERRGGRKKGTPDKATAARQAAMQAAVADCFATMTPAEIEALTPKEGSHAAGDSHRCQSGDVLQADAAMLATPWPGSLDALLGAEGIRRSTRTPRLSRPLCARCRPVFAPYAPGKVSRDGEPQREPPP